MEEIDAKNMPMVQEAGWFGALLMVLFSFTLTPIFGILGLSFLTIQATATRQYNLIALNVFSIFGLILNLTGVI